MNPARPSIIFSALLAFVLTLPAAPDGVTLLQNGKADEALKLLSSQIQNNPNDARAYNLQARVYFQLERWDEAVRAAERSVALSPQESQYHQWLGRTYGRKAEAGGVLTALGLVRKVKAEFEKAVSLDPEGNNLSARADLEEFCIEAPYFMGGDKGKARRLADFVKTRDVALGDFMLARLEEKQNAKDHAEQDYKAAIQASGNQAHYWLALAHFYRRASRPDDMESAVTKALTAPRKDGLPLFDAAWLFYAGGRNFPVAIQLFRQYLSLEDHAEDGPAFQAHYFLGAIFEKQGDNKAAATEYQSALAMAAQYRPAQEALARVKR